MKRSLIVLSLLAVHTVAVAQELSVEDVLPPSQVWHGIEYRAGGVGLEEREAMQAVSHDYSLMLSFARKGGTAYAADTEVTIRDARGRVVLDVVAEGPWLLVRLPAGQYRVTARSTDGTEAVTQRVTVRAKGLARQVMQVREAPAG